MSGGFFRGTTADQDTRFSNKQAKLMKSQKFPAELEHLVDMSKVSMDVIRPWIANRVTELLGFEDEVLINFIYGLLDGKEVNGKQVQIQLTGFMEKNTGKFMKELWTLLLSAQKNASGVPQQFLDAKQEETRKKKEEADRIANEIQKKRDKENKEIEEERLKRMDEGVEAAVEPNSKHTLRASIDPSDGDMEMDRRNGVRSRKRISESPHSDGRSLSPHERHRSKSVSRSPRARGRSKSSERVHYSPRRRTPRGRHSPQGSLSPSMGRVNSRRPRPPSPSRRRLVSPYRRISPSPVRRRRSPSPRRRHRSPSPARRRRSPSPARRRRSPSPARRRRSPPPARRRRSPSPARHRRSPSPLRRRRSPSPARRRRSPSPIHRRISPSPVRRRRSPSPLRRRRSPSPVRRRRSPTPMGRSSSSSPEQRQMLPSPLQRRSRSPMQSPIRRRSPPARHRSRRSPSTPQHRHSSPAGRRSPPGLQRSMSSGSRSPSPNQKIYSPVQHGSPSPVRKVPALSRSPDKSPALSRSPPGVRNGSEERRSSRPYESPRQPRERRAHNVSSSPSRKPREQKLRRSSPEISEENENGDRQPRSSEKRYSSTVIHRKRSPPAKVHYGEEYSPERLYDRGSQINPKNMEHRAKDQDRKREKKGIPKTPDREKSPRMYKGRSDDRKEESYSGEGRQSDEMIHSRSSNVQDSNQHHKSNFLRSSIEKIDNDNHSGPADSGSEENERYKAEDTEKRKHKRSERQEAASEDDYSYDSATEDRKDAKRRRKEEKRLRKEKRRQKREERRRRKEERRAEKLKSKNHSDSSASDGEQDGMRESHSSGNEEAEAEQKKLEIELRKKALESLKAKKGMGH
ncbi:hypothetical protein UlMin_013379 [Ulmus minor]